MPDRRNTDDFDLDDILSSVVIEPDEQFEQRLKMRLRKRLNESTNQQKIASNGWHSPDRPVNPSLQENYPMDKSQMPASKGGLGTRIKSLFVRPADAPAAPTRTWAFSLVALGAIAAVAIMAFVLGGRGSGQVIVASGPSQEETSEPSNTPTTEPTATATEPDPTATERPTERPTERATHEERTPEPGITLEEASTIAGFTVLGLPTVPEGYELVRHIAEPNRVMTIYSLVDVDGGRELWFTQSTPALALNDWLNTDHRLERAVEVRVNGNSAYFLAQDDRTMYNELVWNQGDISFVMGSMYLTQEEMIALANSLQ